MIQVSVTLSESHGISEDIEQLTSLFVSIDTDALSTQALFTNTCGVTHRVGDTGLNRSSQVTPVESAE
jgi:hypothetical protein